MPCFDLCPSLRLQDTDGDALEFRLTPDGKLQEFVNGKLELKQVRTLRYRAADGLIRDDTGEFNLRLEDRELKAIALCAVARIANVMWVGDTPAPLCTLRLVDQTGVLISFVLCESSQKLAWYADGELRNLDVRAVSYGIKTGTVTLDANPCVGACIRGSFRIRPDERLEKSLLLCELSGRASVTWHGEKPLSSWHLLHRAGPSSYGPTLMHAPGKTLRPHQSSIFSTYYGASPRKYPRLLDVHYSQTVAGHIIQRGHRRSLASAHDAQQPKEVELQKMLGEQAMQMSLKDKRLRDDKAPREAGHVEDESPKRYKVDGENEAQKGQAEVDGETLAAAPAEDEKRLNEESRYHNVATNAGARALRAELEAMDKSELRKRALRLGVSKDVIMGAIDADDTKAALVESILLAEIERDRLAAAAARQREVAGWIEDEDEESPHHSEEGADEQELSRLAAAAKRQSEEADWMEMEPEPADEEEEDVTPEAEACTASAASSPPPANSGTGARLQHGLETCAKLQQKIAAKMQDRKQMTGSELEEVHERAEEIEKLYSELQALQKECHADACELEPQPVEEEEHCCAGETAAVLASEAQQHAHSVSDELCSSACSTSDIEVEAEEETVLDEFDLLSSPDVVSIILEVEPEVEPLNMEQEAKEDEDIGEEEEEHMSREDELADGRSVDWLCLREIDDMLASAMLASDRQLHDTSNLDEVHQPQMDVESSSESTFLDQASDSEDWELLASPANKQRCSTDSTGIDSVTRSSIGSPLFAPVPNQHTEWFVLNSDGCDDKDEAASEKEVAESLEDTEWFVLSDAEGHDDAEAESVADDAFQHA